MARTRLLRSLIKLAAEHRLAESLELPVDAIREKRFSPESGAGVLRFGGNESGFTRREFLVGAGVAAAGAFVACGTHGAGRPGNIVPGETPRIAIVGGGIAGLNAALRLADTGLASTVYEASPVRVGGRMLSDRGNANGCGACHSPRSGGGSATWADGQVTEVFGELIDTGHETMQALAKRFDLPLLDLAAAEPDGSEETYYFQGGYYPRDEASADFQPVYTALKRDLKAVGYPTTYEKSTAAGRALDSMSIYEWIESRVPGGHSSRLGLLLDVAYNIEYGAETSDQSALSLVYLLAYSDPKDFSVFGESDERYTIEGGVDRLPTAIAEHLGMGSRVLLGWKLEALERAADESYTLTFQSEGGSRTVGADVVVLAIPFAVLRNLDMSRAGFDERKTQAIRELGAGRNGKLHLQFRSRFWAQEGPWGSSNGSTYADTGYQATWDVSRGQPGESGILAQYTGGTLALSMNLKHPYGDEENSDVVADAQRFLRQIEPVYPGLTALWNGKAAGAMPHKSPFYNSSYAYWRVGQYQAFAGYEQVRQGNVFFAGEHTSIDFQGFMEGAASEGARAADEILKQLGREKAARSAKRLIG